MWRMQNEIQNELRRGVEDMFRELRRNGIDIKTPETVDDITYDIEQVIGGIEKANDRGDFHYMERPLKREAEKSGQKYDEGKLDKGIHQNLEVLKRVVAMPEFGRELGYNLHMPMSHS